MTPLLLSAIAEEAGFPAGAINVVTGLGRGGGRGADRPIPASTWSPSPARPKSGRWCRRRPRSGTSNACSNSAASRRRSCSRTPTARRPFPFITRAITQNGGQTCSAGSRLLVERKIYDDFVGEVVEAFANVRVGTPAMNLDLGPMISAAQRDRVNGFVEAARKSGIPVLAEGRLANDLPSGGFYVTPTLFGPVPRGNSLAQRRSVRPGPVGDAVRRRGGRDRARQRDRLRPGRCGLDARRRPADARRQGRFARPGLHQLLRRRRRRRTAVRRHEEERSRTRKGLSRARGIHRSSRPWCRTTRNEPDA